MKVLVTGSGGQLGSELNALAGGFPGLECLFMDRSMLDIADPLAVGAACRDLGVEAIVNCAAYTAVDRAESEAGAAFRVNRDGPSVLAEAAKSCGALLVHVSTDYVFDGRACMPYREEDPASPLGIYGLSKWEGEEAIRRISPSHIIVRTSWLYSAYGPNFVKTMVRLGRERESVGVVFDQVGTPTHAADLARLLLDIVDRHDRSCRYGETFHYANEGVCSWYDLAKAVMDAEGLACRVVPIESRDYPTPARRPHYSVMNKAKIKSFWGIGIPHWHDSLLEMLGRSGGRGANEQPFSD